MSFGFGVGDFLAVIQTAQTIRKNFAGAPDIYKGARDVARSAQIVLEDEQDSARERELTPEQKARLGHILEGCQKSLTDLNQTLVKYRELGSEASGVREKVRRAWKQLSVEPADIVSLRGRITENIGLLTAFFAQRSGDDVTRIRRLEESRENREVLDWLSAADYSKQQAEYIEEREDGTGQWFLEEPKFTYWRDNIAQTLCCQGIPGAGKTIMTSVVVDELTKRFGQNRNTVVAYLYCNFKRQTEQTLAHLLSNLLKQFCQGRPSLPESVTTLYTRCQERKTVPSSDELKTVIQAVASTYTQAVVLIDALDECRGDDGC
ncbi:hypothetical protein LTR85_000718 [Meristemomyces frigidus]|nr:hypothetical protein LTR85_000718 [Meristemomyces frigidus]